MVKCLYASDPKNLFVVNGKVDRREKFVLSENETSSVTDMIFATIRQTKASNEIFDQLKDNRKLIQKSKEMIETHIDKRIALYFQELVVCYDVPFHFEIGETQHQAPSAPTLIKKKGSETVKVPFNSAHSSTIPCLYAYPIKEWSQWNKHPDKFSKPKPFVYLKGSHVYNSQNATLELIKLVNSADISLDGTKKSVDQLRVKSIKLICQVARDALTPQKALAEFLSDAKKILKSKVDDPKVKSEIRSILKIYLERVENALDGTRDGVLFDQLLDVKLDEESNDANEFRKLIYKRRFDIIRRSQERQSVIAKKIAEVSSKILGINRRPPNYNKILKQKVFSLATSDFERKRLAKLFCVSKEQLDKDLEGKRTATAKKLINDAKFTKDFEKLMREIRRECRALIKEEFEFRSFITRDLRNHKGWRQVDLAKKYEEKFNLPISQPTISRVENTIKLIDRKLAIRLASLFDIDPGIFFPALFTSSVQG